jgi:hypothetical protein
MAENNGAIRVNRGGCMAKRDKILDAQNEYRKDLLDLERRKPQGEVYKLFADNGSEDGRLVYESEDDSVTINLPGVETRISGAHLRSLYSALGDLVG